MMKAYRLLLLRTDNERMTQSGRKSDISPLCNGKGSVFECENYRGIKLMAHTHEVVGANH